MLLRPCSETAKDGSKFWQIVSVVMVADLMEADAIYGSAALSHRQAVRCKKEVFDMSDLIDTQQLGMYNYESDELCQDLAAILVEMGIEVEGY